MTGQWPLVTEQALARAGAADRARGAGRGRRARRSWRSPASRTSTPAACRPGSTCPTGAAGALLYLHGGGFALGDLVTHDGIARRLAARHRLGRAAAPTTAARPSTPWPAAADDAAAAADWLAGQGYDRLAVVGDSAGVGAGASARCCATPARYVAQVQVYPFVDPVGRVLRRRADRRRPAGRAVRAGSGGSTCRAPTPRATRRSTCSTAESLAGQPPALVQLAELDVLTPTGPPLAERLGRRRRRRPRSVVYPRRAARLLAPHRQRPVRTGARRRGRLRGTR